MKNQSKVERVSERELVVSRNVDGPSRLVYEAWTQPALFKAWWVPKSVPMTLESCEIDARTGGKYRLVFSMNSQNMEFLGKYLEVVPYSRLVWTNDEGGEDDAAITTVTFEEIEGTTLVTVHDLYPSRESLDQAITTGATAGMPVQLEQLDEYISGTIKRFED